mgnify:CR=1 FL=1
MGLLLANGSMSSNQSGEGEIRFDLSYCPNFRYPQDFDRQKFKAWLHLSGITGRPRTGEVLVNTEAAERAGGGTCLCCRVPSHNLAVCG